MKESFFSPLLMTVIINNKSFDINKKGDINLTKLKEKYKFSELEVKNKEIIFSNGFPIVVAKISSDEILLSFATKDFNSCCKIMLKFFDDLGITSNFKDNFLKKVELVDFFELEKQEDQVKFFTHLNNYKEYEELNEANFNIDYVKDGKKISITAYYRGINRSVIILSINSPIRIRDEKDYRDKLAENKKFLEDKLNMFIKDRMGTD